MLEVIVKGKSIKHHFYSNASAETDLYIRWNVISKLDSWFYPAQYS